MKTPELPTLTIRRQELEESWRLRLLEARERYDLAAGQYRNALQEQPEGLMPSPDDSLTRARQAKSRALAAYTRVLRIFTDLTVHGRVPEEQSTAASVTAVTAD